MAVSEYPKVHGELATLAKLKEGASWLIRSGQFDIKTPYPLRRLMDRHLVVCAGCSKERSVRNADWVKRKSDYCKGCSVRARVGLKPTSAPSEKGTPLHNIWCGMRQRCGHKKGGHASDIEHYAERGIEVCPEWRTEFEPFKLWALQNGFVEGLYLDRENNDLGYTPSNCRFVTVLESNRNKRGLLDMTKAAAIREAVAAGATQRSMAYKHGVSEATISMIMSGKIWR